MQLSPVSNFRTFSSSPKETPYLLAITTIFLHSSISGNYLFFVSTDLATLYWGNHTVCETNPEYSLEQLILKLKFQHFATSCEQQTHWKRLTGKGRRRRGWQRMRWLDGITDAVDKLGQTLGDSEGHGSLGLQQSMVLQTVRQDWVTDNNCMWCFVNGFFCVV